MSLLCTKVVLFMDLTLYDRKTPVRIILVAISMVGTMLMVVLTRQFCSCESKTKEEGM